MDKEQQQQNKVDLNPFDSGNFMIDIAAVFLTRVHAYKVKQ